jgi:pyruvate,water dikinase
LRSQKLGEKNLFSFNMKNTVTFKTFLSTLSRTFTRRKVPSNPAEFRAVFDRFKNVLDSNNRALETITDMGEKLGGDYLFDIVYVRNAYSRLKEDMVNSLLNFDELTQRRYPRLHDVFRHLDSLITHMVEQALPTAGAPILFFEDIPWGTSQVVGGKNAHLAEVKNQLHLLVPDAFVITTTAFDEFIRHNQLEDRIARLKQAPLPPDTVLQELQELILHGNVPPEVSRRIQKALDKIRRRNAGTFLSLRSSAEEEDSGHSFAGQFKTVLNVPPELESVEQAYRKVIASLYSGKAVAYEQQMGYDVGAIKMAVGCMTMVDAISSGVIYSTTPEGDGSTLIISAAWGLGEATVESRTEADIYVVRKGKEPELVRAMYGKKGSMIITSDEGGTTEVETPDDLTNQPCLKPDQIATLGRQAMTIERYFGSPRDIEWAIDKKGIVYILQARPLNVNTTEQNNEQEKKTDARPAGHTAIVRDLGTVVQRGAGAGKVFIVRTPDDIATLPKDAILVAAHDSSLFVRAMPYVSAIITETGSQTSHMAALCRELQIPTIVNLTKATEILQQGQDITVVANGDTTSVIYEGIIREMLEKAGRDRKQMESVYEYRRKRYILRYISPLHLIDPLMDEFTPERCRTFHDILRFMHEKSVAELVESARGGNAKLKKHGTITQLELPVPAGLLVMDMGGGLEKGVNEGTATVDQITSIPFKAIVKGMIHPGAWHSEAVSLKAQDFLSSMMRMPDITNATDSTAGYNVAVISRDYVNMSIRFGYHFNMVDCYCSENARNNHIYFRFAGGATDLTKRSRRLELLARILKEFGFNIKIKGDMLIARLAGLSQEEMENVLDQAGRLIAYARQLDAMLHDDAVVDRYVQNFLDGRYEF